MEHKLTLVVPDEIYTPLVETAAQEGLEPEAVAVEWLSAGMQQFLHDPIEEFIGKFSSDVPDWAEKHDTYISDSISAHMTDTKESP